MKAVAIALFLQAVSPPSVKNIPPVHADADEPEVHAVDILGASPSAVSRPSETRGFMLQVPSVYAPRTGPSIGFGLAAFPVRTYFGENVRPEKVDPILRMMSGLSVSLAFLYAPKADVEHGISGYDPRLASTIGYQFWNTRDPLRKGVLATCIERAKGRIDECFTQTSTAMAFMLGATSEYGQASFSYEIMYREHAFTGIIDKRFAHKIGDNPFDLGLRYTHEGRHISPTIEGHFEILPALPDAHESTRVRFYAGGGFTVDVFRGFSLTLATRVTPPYFADPHGVTDVRGFTSIGWGGYDMARKLRVTGIPPTGR